MSLADRVENNQQTHASRKEVYIAEGEKRREASIERNKLAYELAKLHVDKIIPKQENILGIRERIEVIKEDNEGKKWHRRNIGAKLRIQKLNEQTKKLLREGLGMWPEWKYMRQERKIVSLGMHLSATSRDLQSLSVNLWKEKALPAKPEGESEGESEGAPEEASEEALAGGKGKRRAQDRDAAETSSLLAKEKPRDKVYELGAIYRLGPQDFKALARALAEEEDDEIRIPSRPGARRDESELPREQKRPNPSDIDNARSRFLK